MVKYIVRDPQGVYPDQNVEVPFDLPTSSLTPLSIGQAKAMVVRVIAIEAMFGCPLSDVDEKVVRDILRSVRIDPES